MVKSVTAIMVTYGDHQEWPSKGKQLSHCGQIESSESISLPAKWTNYTQGNLRFHLPLITCVSMTRSDKWSPSRLSGEGGKNTSYVV